MLLATRAVSLQGAMGQAAIILNGRYEPTEEIACGATVFRKHGDADTWLEYHEQDHMWRIQRTAERGEKRCFGRVQCSPVRLPDQCDGSMWKVLSRAGTGLVPCPSVTVSVSWHREVEKNVQRIIHRI